MNKFAIVAMSVMFAMCANMTLYAQSCSDRIKPSWIKQAPEPSNDTYVFRSIVSFGRTVDEARTKGLADLAAELGFEKGVTTVTDMYSEDWESSTWRNDQSDEKFGSTFVVNSTIKGKDVSFQVKSVDEYWIKGSSGEISMTRLFAHSLIDKNASFDRVIVTTKYGFDSMWRSVIPGWGQMYKGDWLKGGVFMGGTVALAGGALFTHLQSNIYDRKVYEAGGKEEAMRVYANRARNFGTARNVCLGGLAALYVYNIIDAFVAPGAKRVEVIPNGVAVNF